MILTGKEIEREVAAGTISVTPYNPAQVNPNSYDFRLGKELLTYNIRGECPDLDPPANYPLRDFYLDSREENRSERYLIPEEGVILLPGHLYLACTEEVFHTDKYVGVVDGKSSMGRLGIFVHVSAGFVDAGFKGQVTLEVVVVHPVKVYPGMRFGQIRFHSVQGELSLYKGNYQGETAMGPQPSRSWKQVGTL